MTTEYQITLPTDSICFLCLQRMEAHTPAVYVVSEGIRHIECDTKGDEPNSPSEDA